MKCVCLYMFISKTSKTTPSIAIKRNGYHPLIEIRYSKKIQFISNI